ncbi:putative sulfate exporter family transporter, partial [Escherichia coli]|uniref:putative sulfate exporter family transporter n=1 Tax=Escherichia coli TaxID=562 RepID=UPI0034D536CD
MQIDPRVLANFLFRGVCAIVEAYLIYWALVYWVARRYFGFTREWAAPLASGISICGVSAAIATGAAIRARPLVPIMVSSLVIVFAVVELLI